MTSSPAYAAFVGIDWADQEHAVCLISSQGSVSSEALRQDPQAIAAWVNRLKLHFPGGTIAIAVEQRNGPLIHALMQHDNLVLFPINPRQLARYRESIAPSGGKDDPSDARLLAQFLRMHHEQFKPWIPDEPKTRELGRLCELRRSLVDERTRLVLKLTSLLKSYYPLPLNLLMGELTSERTLALLKRWPTHQQLCRAHPGSLRRFLQKHGYRNEEQINGILERIRGSVPLTDDNAINEPAALYAQALVEQIRVLNKQIGRFEEQIQSLLAQHDDAPLFRSLPGAGDALVPRLLVAFGSDRDRYASAEEIQCYSGIAPVMRRSGQSSTVKRRRACPQYLRQTFHEFAHQAKRWSRWSRAFYELQIRKGKKHQAAIRALAFKWIRIIFRMWKTRQAYDEQQYINTLRQRNSPIVPLLDDA